MRSLISLVGLSLFAFAASPVFAQNKDKMIPVVETGAHIRPIIGTFFSGDGKQVITVSTDRTIRSWDVATRDLVRVLYLPQGLGADGDVTACAMSADGKLLAVASHWLQQGGNRVSHLYVLDVEAGSIVQTFEGFREPILDIDVSRDGKWLAASSDKEKTIRIWRIGSTRFQHVLEGSLTYRKHLAFSPDGRSLVVAEGHPSMPIRLWDLTTGQIKHELKEKHGACSSLAWSPDGKTIATGHADGLRLRKPDLNVYLHVDTFPSCHVRAFSPDSKSLPVLWYQKTPSEYKTSFVDPASGTVTMEPQKKLGFLTGGAFSPDSSKAALFYRGVGLNPIIICQLKDGQVEATGTVQRRFPSPSSARLGFNKEGTTLGEAKGWTFNLRELRFGPAPVEGDSRGPVEQEDPFVFGKTVSSTNRFPVLKGDKLLPAIPRPPGDDWAGGLARTLFGKERVVLGSAYGDLHLWGLSEAKTIRRLRAHDRTVYWIAPIPGTPCVISYGDLPTFCIWNPDQNKLLLNLVFLRIPTKAKDEGEWIAWTPEGFYACSTGTESKLGFLTDKGVDKMATFTPAAKLRKALYRPDVIKRLVELGSVEKALEASGVKASFRSIAELTPPDVSLKLPVKAGSVVKQPQIKVVATVPAAALKTVQKLQLMLDGRPYQGDSSLVHFKASDPAPAWDVVLPAGKHHLSLLITTPVISSTTDEVELTYAAPAVDTRPDLYLLSIGINSYPSPWTLRCAKKDAEGIEKVFQAKSKAVYREVKTMRLTDNQATKEGIRSGLAWLQKNMQAYDVAIIFYAGHGMNDKDGNFYLLPSDTNFQAPEKTAIADEEIKKRLADIPGRILVLFDACHSGGTRTRIDRLARDLSDDDCGVVVMCAATGREEAGEDAKLGHGYFALAVIEGLSGKADRSKKDKMIYLHHLDVYVYEAVESLSNGEQHPVVGRPTSVRTFALAKP